MQLSTVPLSSLLPPKDNPRRTLDKSLIAGLAQSIKTDGVLQNLLVRPEGDGTYRVIFGKRRYLALQNLKKSGDIDDRYLVPVEIKDDLADADASRLATVENLQREQLHPMDEAEAFARLLQGGGSVEDIVEKTGFTAQTVKRRLALATLCSDAKKALRAGTINRSVAEALTLAPKHQQRAILEGIDIEGPPDGEEIREMLLSAKPSLSIAIFPRERYSGELTTDLFADAETTYFDDVDQFLSLQEEAVEALAVEHRLSAAWVEVLRLYSPPWWQYREAEIGEPGGVVINFHPSGSVEVREGLARHEVRETVIEATRQTPLAPRPARQRPEFAAELLRFVACHKSAAVQAALLANPRKGKEVAVLVLLLGFRTCIGARLTLHPCHEHPGNEREQRSYRAVDLLAAELCGRLGLAEDERPGVARLSTSSGAVPLYEALSKLTDEDLDRLHVLLPILCFGEERLTDLDTGDSLFNRIAGDIGIEMRSWWIPDAAFLSGLVREQVAAIAVEVGAAPHVTGFHSCTKKQLVEELARYFAERSDPATLGPHEPRIAIDWLPGLFRFPAINTVLAAPPAT